MASETLPKVIAGTSLKNYSWLSRLDEQDVRQALRLAQIEGLNELLARLLIGRLVPPDQTQTFLSPKLRDNLPDPSSLKDADTAANMINQALSKKKTIAVFADYDVDGACSAALIANYARAFNQELIIHIPDREKEGYGPNEAAIERFSEAGADLLITVDCGSTSAGVLAYARQLGLKTIIIDHHQMNDTSPEVDALVNPNRPDDLSSLGHLCAAGVVFMVLVAANRARKEATTGPSPLPDLMALLDLVAMATICDVVPLKGLNRAFVTQGLSVARQNQRPGLTALCRVARLDRPLEAHHFGFMLGPRINAGGRIGDSSLGTKLLLSQNPDEALRLANCLDLTNKERQEIEQQALADAVQEAETLLLNRPDLPVLIVGSSHWPVGVVGLVAARLREAFDRPAIAISWRNDGTGTASGRSIDGLDLGQLIAEANSKQLLIKGGGHAMAAGLTLRREAFDEFDAFIQDRAFNEVSQHYRHRHHLIDGEASASGFNVALVKELLRAAPFGRGNDEPMIAFYHHKITYTQPVGRNHLKLTLSDPYGGHLKVMAFKAMDNQFGAELSQRQGETLHFIGTPMLDTWQGREQVTLRLVDAALTTS